mmetsp:Transcript_7365/g.13551  ORF Transcript_7365/g.13551 Transcript_7365/m.13551 type:complete len:92 (-) Transcript_7365:76-351(-)
MYQMQPKGLKAVVPRNAPLRIESLNLLGRIKVTELKNGIEDIEACRERVFVNFGIKNKPAMYVHEDADCYADDDFYKTILKAANITPPKAT